MDDMKKSQMILLIEHLCTSQTDTLVSTPAAIPFTRLRLFPRKNVLELFMLSCFLCFPLCFTSQMKHALPTSGSKSTFIFDSLSFTVLGSATWSLSLRTAGYRNWIPFIDMLGMANPVGEITATPEVWASLFPSLVSRGRITAHFCLHMSWQAGIFAVMCKLWTRFKAFA